MFDHILPLTGLESYLEDWASIRPPRTAGPCCCGAETTHTRPQNSDASLLAASGRASTNSRVALVQVTGPTAVAAELTAHWSNASSGRAGVGS